MPTRNIVLTNRLEQLVNELVNSGRYQNASEVIREGLRLLEQREMEVAACLEAYRNQALNEMQSKDEPASSQHR